jgi:NDP-sugar pyrophosphorylase family protein
MNRTTGYINAGGRGTRLSPIFQADPTLGISKALLRLGEPPITLVEHHINRLARTRIETIVAGVGDHAHVGEYVNQTYGDYANIHALSMPEQLGNGGDLVRAVRDHPELFGDHVIIANVDTLIDLDIMAVRDHHLERDRAITIVLTHNRGVPNENAFFVGPDDEVLYTHEAAVNPVSESEARRWTAYRASSTGVLAVRAQFLRDLAWTPQDGPLSLYKDIMMAALAQRSVSAYNNQVSLFVDVGTVATWNEMTSSGSPARKHLCYEPPVGYRQTANNANG